MHGKPLTLDLLLKAALVAYSPDIGVAVQVGDEGVKVSATDAYILVAATLEGTRVWVDDDRTAVIKEKKDVDELVRFTARHKKAQLVVGDDTIEVRSGQRSVTVPATIGGYPKVTRLIPAGEEDISATFTVDPAKMVQAAKIWTLLAESPVDLTPRGRKPAVARDNTERWVTLVMPVRKDV